MTETPKMTMEKLQSTLRLRDAEIQQKDAELDEKRGLLHKTKGAIEELQDAFYLSKSNEQRLQRELDTLGASYGAEVTQTNAELADTRDLLERCQKEKQLLQVDGAKKEAEIRRMEKAMSVLRESLNESAAKMEMYAAKATDLEAALKEKGADLNESLYKIGDLEREKTDHKRTAEMLRMQLETAQETGQVMSGEWQTKFEKSRQEMRRTHEIEWRAARIKWIQEQLEREEDLKQEHAQAMHEMESAFALKLQHLQEEKEGEMLESRQILEEMETKYEHQKMQWTNGAQHRLGHVMKRISDLRRKAEQLEKTRLVLQSKTEMAEEAHQREILRRLQQERAFRQRALQWKTKLFEERSATKALAKKLDRFKKLWMWTHNHRHRDHRPRRLSDSSIITPQTRDLSTAVSCFSSSG